MDFLRSQPRLLHTILVLLLWFGLSSSLHSAQANVLTLDGGTAYLSADVTEVRVRGEVSLHPRPSTQYGTIRIILEDTNARITHMSAAIARHAQIILPQNDQYQYHFNHAAARMEIRHAGDLVLSLPINESAQTTTPVQIGVDGTPTHLRVIESGGRHIADPSIQPTPGLHVVMPPIQQCMNRSNLDNPSSYSGIPFVEAYLNVNNRVVAKAPIYGYATEGFCITQLDWKTPDGGRIRDWDFLFSGQQSQDVTFTALMGNGNEEVLRTDTIQRPQLTVNIATAAHFPTLERNLVANFTARVQGGDGNYRYDWQEIREFSLDGFGYYRDHIVNRDNGSADVELPSYNELYRVLLNNGVTRSRTNLHAVELKVTDGQGLVGYARFLATVAMPHQEGNPSLSGSSSQLQRGVDVVSGNYHYPGTDLSVSGKGPDFVVTRAYNSRPGQSNGEWTFNLDMRMWYAPFEHRQLFVKREDGRTQSFFRDYNDRWHALNPGNFDQLVQGEDGTFTLYTQGNLLYHFADPRSAGSGRLNAIADRDGNRLSFSHDGNNRITRATDASGRAYTITRDANGRITQVADFTSRSVTYTWDASNMITAAHNPKEQKTRYAYDGTRLIRITDPRNNIVAAIAYDTASGRVSSVTDALNQAWQFSYTTTLDNNGLHGTGVSRPRTHDVNNNLAFVIDGARTRVLERIDSSNASLTRARYRTTTNLQHIAEFALVDRSERPSGASTNVFYSNDGRGNPVSIGDALNRVTRAAWADELLGQPNLTPLASVQRPGITNPTQYRDFTASGKAGKVIDPLGNTTTRQYHNDGLLEQMTDARSNRTSILYDDHGRPTRITDALNGSTETTYDALGRVLTERNARGHTTTYTYDANGNVLTITDPANGVTHHSYDENDNLISITDPRGHTTTYVYDALNRKIEERYTVAGQTHVRQFEYDALGRLQRVVNERGNASETRFDLRGNVLQEINPLSQTVSYTYDANGNVLTVTDAEGRSLTYQYDALDRKTRVTDALGNDEAYTYNAQGLLASKRDARGKTTRYEYDALDRMIKVIDADGEQTLASYDANGNLISTTDRRGNTVQYSYDALDRMISLTDAQGRQWQFTYDANGNMLTRRTPSGDITSYTYNSRDLVTQVSYPDGTRVSYSYDANGNRISMTDANGTTTYSYDERNRLVSVTDAFDNTVGYSYDLAGNLEQLTYPGNRSVSYSHDAAERLSSLTDWLNHTTRYSRDASGAVTEIIYDNGARVQKGYDRAGRLTSLTNRNGANGVISRHALTLDGVGNPTGAELTLPLLPTNLGKAAEMIYDRSNRLSSIDGVGISHDLDGRLTADPTLGDPIQYAYNAHDLITSITEGGVLTDSYLYDGDGRRVARTQGNQTTRYVLDPTGGNLYRLLAETNSSNQVQYYYIYGDGGLVSQISGTQHRYYHFDQIGNTIALTDGSGTVTDSYAYEPFGNTTTEGSSHNPFRFVGEYGVMDDGNGLHHMRARYYRPDLRRFVSLDALHGEITDPMSLNRYQYVSGNPKTGIDPTGLRRTDISFDFFVIYLEGEERSQFARFIYWSNVRKQLRSKGLKLSSDMEDFLNKRDIIYILRMVPGQSNAPPKTFIPRAILNRIDYIDGKKIRGDRQSYFDKGLNELLLDPQFRGGVDNSCLFSDQAHLCD